MTEQRADGAHRWLRCMSCNASIRTLEQYYRKSKPGPLPGTPRPGPRARGSSNGASVLTEDDVRRLRELVAAGVTQRNIAQEYGIAPATVSRIVTRKLWSHI
jgi:hypothetical protein